MKEKNILSHHFGHTLKVFLYFLTCNICLFSNAWLTGVGILSVPYALASGGWLSLLLLFIIASSSLYTGLLIQRCMDMNPNIRSYPDIGEFAFGKSGRALVSILMNTELYMVATGFLILEGDNLSNILPDVEFQIGSLTIGGKKGFVILVSLVILPTVLLNNMSFISYISASGVIASVVLLFAVFWSGAFHGIGFHESGSVLNWKGIPAAVSLYAFCYCAHPVFPTLYISMRNQKKFSTVIIIYHWINNYCLHSTC